jgi:hypothetical protein
MTIREQKAKRALEEYWRNSGVALPFSDLEKIILERSPRFYSQFGASIEFSELSETKVNELMRKLAKENSGKWPDANETSIFFDALLDEIGSFSNKVSLVKTAIAETGSEIVSASKFVLSGYLVASMVGLALLIYSMSKK